MKKISESQCDRDGVLYKGKCYYFHGDQETHFESAKESCERAHPGGSLAVIQSQDENDFISEAFFAKYSEF